MGKKENENKEEKLMLDKTHPELCRQWHPTKNVLNPSDVTAGSGKKVWWYLPYYDSKTKKTFYFEWQATVWARSNGSGCPYLTHGALWTGFNDIGTLRPDLTLEWDNHKNGNLTPRDVVCGSNKSVWWKCKKGHSWKAKISNRCILNRGCPHCSREIKTSFPEQVVYYYINRAFQDAQSGCRNVIDMELDIYIPSIRVAIEYDGYAWHKDIQRDLRKNNKCQEMNIRMIRIREDGCPEMSSDDFCTIFKTISNNNYALSDAIGQIAAYLNVEIDVDIERDIAEIQSLVEYMQKENSISKLFPRVAKEWHPTKNGNLKPENISAQSSRVMWWYLPYDDPVSGLHFDWEWKAAINDRTYGGDGCPYLSGAKIDPAYNSLLVLNPSLSGEWNYDKNKGLTNKKGEDISSPDKVGPGSHQYAWWKCSKCTHEWRAKIENRHRLGRGCPECAKEKLRQPRKRKTISQSEITFNSNEQSA